MDHHDGSRCDRCVAGRGLRKARPARPGRLGPGSPTERARRGRVPRARGRRGTAGGRCAGAGRAERGRAGQAGRRAGRCGRPGAGGVRERAAVLAREHGRSARWPRARYAGGAHPRAIRGLPGRASAHIAVDSFRKYAACTTTARAQKRGAPRGFSLPFDGVRCDQSVRPSPILGRSASWLG